MSSFSEKIDDYLLGSDSCASSLCWIWFVLKHAYSRLLFTFGLICVNKRFITCHDDVDMFTSAAIIFSDQSIRAFFFERLTNFVGSNANNFFWQSNVLTILNIGTIKAWGCLNFTIGNMMILQYQLAHRINGFRNNNNWFWTTITKFVLEWTTTSV